MEKEIKNLIEELKHDIEVLSAQEEELSNKIAKIIYLRERLKSIVKNNEDN